MPPAPMRWRRGGRSSSRLLQRALLLAAFSAAALILLVLQHHHGPKRPNPSAASHARDSSDELLDDSPPAERDPDASDPAVVVDRATCATVEMMGEEAAGAGRGSPEQASLRVREMIRRHFELHGAERVRMLPAHEFCKQGFVLGKASEAGFGNEMYKILTAGALSVMLNRSLIIGQTRHMDLHSATFHVGLYPFGEYISYTNQSFTIHEIKHLWRKHRCARTYGRDLNIRVDIFENPTETNVLCSDWNSWKDSIIWFDGATDAVGIQFFLKNVHPRMKAAASALFGLPDSLYARPNTFGELMRAIISPSSKVQEAVDWALKGVNPDIVLHMRMMANRPVRARKAAVLCIKKALQFSHIKGTALVALVSDTPAFVKEIKSDISEFAEVLNFDYKLFAKTSSLEIVGNDKARYAVVTGAHRRVGTTYAQLITALAAANRHGREPSGTNFTFLSSVHSNLLVEGLSTQVGWGHIWNRYAGPLSCRRQPHQCALTPLLPPAWWDGRWQSPIPRDVRRLLEYGVRLSDTGEVDERHLLSYCRSRKDHVKRFHVLPPYKNPARL
ncbi:Rhamnogalacturonate lyase family protein [Zea mays]|uniref:Rhamnogalacturonate lyase family protein n=1 Tax=Zea mays TaxID=4577 RepID=A0A1D6PTG2_MAIZE|nr:Rhamnogalacturonate lyase family protein [Zea mays]